MLDYSQALALDAEALAKGGIVDAYRSLMPELLTHIDRTDDIAEIMDPEAPSYSVLHGEREYPIYGPEIEDDDGRSWGNAMVALFSIVNDQLQARGSAVRLYAINGGNDLMGLFLTKEQAIASRQSLKHPRDWPYLPQSDHPA
jgi:hypothetical protein